MGNFNPQAAELNEIIKENNESLFEMLSERGKGIFFPSKGILGQSAEAKGKKINATIGMAVEDDGSPMRLKSIAKNIRLEPAKAFTYAPSQGVLELRKKWKEMIFQKNPSLKASISLPVVTNALTHGLSMIGYLFCNEGDSIISPDLYWGNYNLIFKNAYGAKIEVFETFANGKFNTAGLKKMLLAEESKKKIVLLNFPNNPAGYTPAEKEVLEIVSCIKESANAGNQVIAIIDDAYFGLVYKKGIFKESLFARLADLDERVLAIKLDGATKEDYAWGFRVGFISFGIKGATEKVYSSLEAKTAGAVRGSISNAPHISQSLVFQAFNDGKYAKEKAQKFRTLKKRFETVAKVLKGHPEYNGFFTAFPFNSGYFMCLKLREGLDGEKVRKRLLEEYNTGVISTGSLLRIAFSSVPKKLIPELFENIYNACKE